MQRKSNWLSSGRSYGKWRELLYYTTLQQDCTTMQMLSRIKLVVIVIAWSSAVLTSYSTSVLASPCNLSGSLSGEVFRPPHFTTPISTWSLQTDGNKPTHETDWSVQGVLKGAFSAPELNIESPVLGAWSYNETDGKLLIILSGNTFGIDSPFEPTKSKLCIFRQPIRGR